MIGIIVAMKIEAEKIAVSMKNIKKERFGRMEFVSGEIGSQSVVMLESGIGKVNASVGAAILIERYCPDQLISTGIAGAVSGVRTLDTLIAVKTCQHDNDATAFGHPKGWIFGQEKVFLESDKKLVDIFKSAIPAAKCGILASGDQFVASNTRKEQIRDDFGAMACDMESGAVAQTAEIFSLPFVAIRVISDDAEDGSEMTYNELSERASIINSQAVIAAIKAFSDEES